MGGGGCKVDHRLMRLRGGAGAGVKLWGRGGGGGEYYRTGVGGGMPFLYIC